MIISETWDNRICQKFEYENFVSVALKVPMTRKFLLFYLKEHEKISGLAVYSNTVSLLVAKLLTKI